MDYRRFSSRLCLAVVITSLTVTAGGCTSVLATGVWLIKGPNVDAEFDILREKKVVVVRVRLWPWDRSWSRFFPQCA